MRIPDHLRFYLSRTAAPGAITLVVEQRGSGFGRACVVTDRAMARRVLPDLCHEATHFTFALTPARTYDPVEA